MSCATPLTRVHAAVDGELDVAAALEMESHLRECPACAAEYRRALALRAALRETGVSASPSQDLEYRVRASLKAGRPGRRGPVLRQTLALAATLVVGVLLGRFLLPSESLRSRSGGDALVDGHVRALAAGPLTEVASSDRHTVKPWFAGKLDFSPKVVDLSAEGFPLEGGRVDRIADHPAAALVYRRGPHAITLYVSLADGVGSSGTATREIRGFHVVRWTERDLAYAAVSDLNEKELLAFADLVRR